MFEHLSTRERFARVGLGGIALLICGYVGASRIRQPAPLSIQSVPVANLATPSKDSAAREVPPAATVAAEDEVVVHVVGAVKNPGIQRLKAGQRVADAVAGAGGATPDANLEGVNLAAKVVDGVQIVVPHKAGPLPIGAIVPLSSVAVPESSTPRAVEISSSSSSRIAKKAPSGPVNLNSASAAQLESLPGIGPATAQKILDYRSEHGRFGSVDELLAVKGIGEKKLAKLREWVRI